VLEFLSLKERILTHMHATRMYLCMHASRVTALCVCGGGTPVAELYKINAPGHSIKLEG
jgi:hypothetical protein